jgi:murein DD-endopeptidase MepM/ murein hydrolase activator NlpD
VTVAPGDNLSLIFSRLKLPKTELHEIMALGAKTAPLKQLRPGQIVRIKASDDAIHQLILEIDQLTSLKVERSSAGYSAAEEITQPEIKITAATTSITHSLFLDGQKVGLSDAVIMRLTDIFGWDIDFALDLRKDDHFSVIYEEMFKDGELVKQDRILAAEFVNQGKRHRAVLYTDASGNSAYYSDTGEAMRKAFLRTPVNFTRISSRFNLSRKHPILNTIRAHRGVDYAAPMGTPIRATADGKIRSVGYGNGYGRTVELQHGDAYSTLYAHMSRFARGLKRGSGVRQGQVIGYVGKSGLATGPHLHYEFRINGVHRNPLTVALPKSLPIERRYLADFRAKSAPLLSQLDVLVARLENNRATYVAQLDGSKFMHGDSATTAN